MTKGSLDLRRKKLLHRARYRGFKEADLLIGGFAEAALASMTAADLDAFERVLDCADHEICDWIINDAPAPVSIERTLIDRMKAFDAASRLRDS